MNQIRGFLMERGITIRKGPSHLTAGLQGLLEDADMPLSGRLRLLILKLKHEWEELETRIEAANIVHELNSVMTWIGYPGRTSGTATVENLDFAVVGGTR